MLGNTKMRNDGKKDIETYRWWLVDGGEHREILAILAPLCDHGIDPMAEVCIAEFCGCAPENIRHPSILA